MSTYSKSGREVDGALEPHIQVEEKGKRELEQYPSDIVDQLKRAAFNEGEQADTYIKRITPSNGTDNPKVVTVELRENSLVIDVEDVVGIVNLTPNSTLQIDPKIGWDDILEMFLKVGQQRRSLDYRGIPIRDFLADDIGIEDIFIVVAVNYLNSLDDIFRHGFIRSFDRERTRALDSRGRIDITKSLKNFDIPNGVPKHEFVQKVVEYGIPVNDIIYKAGKELQKLFYLYPSANTDPNYARIFSRLERSLTRLEKRGITGESIEIRDLSKIVSENIPRQRGYYKDSLEISKSILSSSIGQPLDQGREELMIEYILSMNSLFEEFNALVLEEELQSLQENEMVEGLDSVTVEKSTYELFENDSLTFSSQPDHVMKSSEGPIAILDSKYYAEDKNPLKGNWSRSRLLSYGFHLEAEKLAMIAPLATPASHKFAGRSGELTIISPDTEEFSTDGLRTAIRNYITDHIGTQREMSATDDLQNRLVCHPEVEASVLDDVLDDTYLESENIVADSRKILTYIVKEKRLSDEITNTRKTSPILGANKNFSKYLEEESADYDIVIPFFIPSGDEEADLISSDDELIDQRPELEDANEFIKIHCIKTDEKGSISEYESPPPFGLNW